MTVRPFCVLATASGCHTVINALYLTNLTKALAFAEEDSRIDAIATPGHIFWYGATMAEQSLAVFYGQGRLGSIAGFTFLEFPRS